MAVCELPVTLGDQRTDSAVGTAELTLEVEILAE